MKKSIHQPNEAQISCILGVDYGRSKIGIAIADEETKIAFAFDTLLNNKDFFAALEEIVACENVKTIVIGMTKHEMDQKSVNEKEKFAKELKNHTGVQVFLQEEMFSTKLAHTNIKESGKKNIAKFDDAEAARIILQSWLDNN